MPELAIFDVRVRCIAKTIKISSWVGRESPQDLLISHARGR